ncbi:hypothetical protein DFH09DRAFT_1328741 [Mycena vulgaris]|nr:hypothetical protein DFH09DRAFT_1328741 [Mycena vulgaris]
MTTCAPTTITWGYDLLTPLLPDLTLGLANENITTVINDRLIPRQAMKYAWSSVNLPEGVYNLVALLLLAPTNPSQFTVIVSAGADISCLSPASASTTPTTTPVSTNIATSPASQSSNLPASLQSPSQSSTTPNTSVRASSRPNPRIIAGAVVGSLVIAAGALTVYLIYRRSLRLKPSTITPLMLSYTQSDGTQTDPRSPTKASLPRPVFPHGTSSQQALLVPRHAAPSQGDLDISIQRATVGGGTPEVVQRLHEMTERVTVIEGQMQTHGLAEAPPGY